MERNQLREGEKQEEREKQKKSWIVAKGERKRGTETKIERRRDVQNLKDRA